MPVQVELTTVELWSWSCRYLATAINDPTDRGFFFIRPFSITAVKSLTINQLCLAHNTCSCYPDGGGEQGPAFFHRPIVQTTSTARLDRRFGPDSCSGRPPSLEQTQRKIIHKTFLFLSFIFFLFSWWLPLHQSNHKTYADANST